jgi:PleD family two-component response regulator
MDAFRSRHEFTRLALRETRADARTRTRDRSLRMNSSLLGKPRSDLDKDPFPDVSGFELCSRLRDGEPGRRWNRDVPVIMVSSRGDPVDRVRGFARGCDDYIVKPSAFR